MEIDEVLAKPGSTSTACNGERNPTRVVSIERAVYEAICAHGEESYPAECCGALLGHSTADGWRIEAAVRARNASGSPQRRYEIAAFELVGIERKARDPRMEIAGFYHSHPDHPAQWSSSDLAEAHWLGCCYVITAVEQGKAGVTRSFLLAGAVEENKCFREQAIQIRDENGCPGGI